MLERRLRRASRPPAPLSRCRGAPLLGLRPPRAGAGRLRRRRGRPGPCDRRGRRRPPAGRRAVGPAGRVSPICGLRTSARSAASVGRCPCPLGSSGGRRRRPPRSGRRGLRRSPGAVARHRPTTGRPSSLRRVPAAPRATALLPRPRRRCSPSVAAAGAARPRGAGGAPGRRAPVDRPCVPSHAHARAAPARPSRRADAARSSHAVPRVRSIGVCAGPAASTIEAREGGRGRARAEGRGCVASSRLGDQRRRRPAARRGRGSGRTSSSTPRSPCGRLVDEERAPQPRAAASRDGRRRRSGRVSSHVTDVTPPAGARPFPFDGASTVEAVRQAGVSRRAGLVEVVGPPGESSTSRYSASRLVTGRGASPKLSGRGVNPALAPPGTSPAARPLPHPGDVAVAGEADLAELGVTRRRDLRPRPAARM